jgi:hypothetical protein
VSVEGEAPPRGAGPVLILVFVEGCDLWIRVTFWIVSQVDGSNQLKRSGMTRTMSQEQI